jgi:hypothetical protein
MSDMEIERLATTKESREDHWPDEQPQEVFMKPSKGTTVHAVFFVVALAMAGAADAAKLKSLQITPNPVEGGKSITLHLGLDRPGSVIVDLKSSDTSVIPHPGPVSFSNSALVVKNFTTKSVTSKKSVTITAKFDTSKSQTVSVIPTIPSKPGLQSPSANGVYSWGARFKWSASSPVGKYYLLIAPDGNTNWNHDHTTAAAPGLRITDCGTNYTCEPTSIFPGIKAVWRVEAYNYGSTRLSDQRTVYIPLGQPTLNSPGNSASSRSPTFSWGAVSGGPSSYQILITSPSNNQVARKIGVAGNLTSYQMPENIPAEFGSTINWEVLACKQIDNKEICSNARRRWRATSLPASR